MKLCSLDKFNEIVIQIHDNPDADAVGAGYAMYRYLQEKGKSVRLVYGGRNEISKSNMKLMVAELEIPLEHVRELAPPELLLTVDCQHGQGNVQLFEAENIAMIDHHSTGKESDDMAEIRSHMVSCSSICYDMLTEAGFDVNKDIRIATGLYYGLFMDSNQLSEINHPIDRDMVDFLQYDKQLVSRMKFANFSISELETAGIAITNNNYIENYRCAIVKAEPCDPNILGVIGDFVIQVDSIDVCLIYNECPGGYKLSVRSCALDVKANELAEFLTHEIGNGGGHLDKAGGYISTAKFASKYPESYPEEYFRMRMKEYFECYDVIRYTDGCRCRDELKRYRKRKGYYGFVPSTELFAEGTKCKIRTLEGDVFITAEKDVFIVIGSRGEIYPISRDVFESKYEPTGALYTNKFEYDPTIINIDENRSYPLMPMALECTSRPGAEILAKPLTRYTKVFTKWDYESYMAGNVGDMLCYSVTDDKDVYVSQKDIFDEIYELV